MNGLHGIIFSYEKRNDLRELSEIRSSASIPTVMSAWWILPCPIW